MGVGGKSEGGGHEEPKGAVVTSCGEVDGAGSAGLLFFGDWNGRPCAGWKFGAARRPD